jgi:hypothetical protein
LSYTRKSFYLVYVKDEFYESQSISIWAVGCSIYYKYNSSY